MTSISDLIQLRSKILAQTYCSYCKRTASDGAILSWVGQSSDVVCEQKSCNDACMASWDRHMAALAEEEEFELQMKKDWGHD